MITDTIEPGKGYWVKAKQKTSIISPNWEKIAGLSFPKVTIHPTSPNVIYTTTEANFGVPSYGAVMKSTDGGMAWDTLIKNVDGHGVILDQSNPSVGYALLGTANGCIPGIRKTTDGGTTWFRADSGITLDSETKPAWLVVDPHNTQILYAQTWGFYGSSYPYRSTDGGKYWSSLVNLDSVHCPGDTLCWLGILLTLTIDPQNSNMLYAVTLFESDLNVLFSSTNGGLNWNILYRFPVSTFGYLGKIAVDSQDSDILYMGAKGFFRSTDRGQSWQNSGAGLPESTGFAFLLSNYPHMLYAGTFSGSLYKSTDAGQTWYPLLIDSSENIDMQAIDEIGGFVYSGRIDGFYRLKICGQSNN